MQKLDKVLKVRQLAERESAQTLAKSQAARAEAESAQAQLRDLMAQYRSHHSEVVQDSPGRFRQFLRFYDQLSVAVNTQEQVVKQLSDAESVDLAAHMERYKERVALERLLSQRDQVEKYERTRTERKAHIQRQPNSLH